MWRGWAWSSWWGTQRIGGSNSTFHFCRLNIGIQTYSTTHHSFLSALALGQKKGQTDCRRRCVFAMVLGKPNPVQRKIANILCKTAELMSSTIFPCLFCNHFLFVNTSRKNLSRSSIQKVQIQWKGIISLAKTDSQNENSLWLARLFTHRFDHPSVLVGVQGMMRAVNLWRNQYNVIFFQCLSFLSGT